MKPEDDVYLLSSFEEAGTCTIHTDEIIVEPEPYDPSKFDPGNPSTWPTKEEDPNFDSKDPSTWPTVGGYLPPDPVESQEPSGGDPDPVETPPESTSPEPLPTPDQGEEYPLMPPGA